MVLLALVYSQLISICVPVEKNSGAVYSVDMDRTLIFIEEKDKSMMIKCKLHPGQKNKSLIILLTELQLSANTCTDRMLMLMLSYSDPSPAARTELQQLTSQAAAFFPTCSCFSIELLW